MNDTSTEIAEIVRARYARMSGAMRVMIGADMFETARALVLASFPPGLRVSSSSGSDQHKQLMIKKQHIKTAPIPRLEARFIG